MTDGPSDVRDATDLAAAIRGGETTALAAMRAALDRIEARADLGAVCHVDAAMGLEGAAAFDGLLARRSARATRAPFGGVPFLMKDLGNAARDLPPLAGSRALAARRPATTADSTLARRFRRAGLVPFGLTTTPEFGLALTSEPPGGPVARNPFDPALSPGGSSGGAAAAVAGGLVAIAHATDAAGSIRVPAACCGLVGLKPTRGATPNGPDFGNHLLGIVGELVVARSVRDARTALDATAGDGAGPVPDPDLDGLDLSGPFRIGWLDEAAGLGAIGSAQAEAVRSAAAVLEAAGHRLVRLDGAPLAAHAATANRVARTILSVSLAGWMAYLGARPDELSPLAEAVRAEGARLPATALFRAEHEAALLAHALWRRFETVDLIVTPMLAGPPPAVGAYPPDHVDTDRHWGLMATTAPYAALANVGGIPALAVPHGRDTAGLPLSVQLLGPMGADRLLLAAADLLAAARPWSYPWDIAGMPA